MKSAVDPMGCPAIMRQRVGGLRQKSENICAPRLAWRATLASSSVASVWAMQWLVHTQARRVGMRDRVGQERLASAATHRWKPPPPGCMEHHRPMSLWIDTHCHLDAPEFDPDRDAVRRRAAAQGVGHCVI